MKKKVSRFPAMNKFHINFDKNFSNHILTFLSIRLFVRWFRVCDSISSIGNQSQQQCHTPHIEYKQIDTKNNTEKITIFTKSQNYLKNLNWIYIFFLHSLYAFAFDGLHVLVLWFHTVEDVRVSEWAHSG